MNRREKMLMFGLFGAVAIWQGSSVVDSVFFAPASERATRIQSLEADLGKKKIRKRELEIAQAKLKGWTLRSLPPDPLTAATLYQNGLIDLGNKSKLASLKVTPLKRIEPKPKGGTYYTVSVTINARGTVTDLCNFLYEFHQSGLLHRMTRITASSNQHEGNPSLELVMSAEALALVNAPARTTLFPKGANGDEKLVPDQPLRSRSDYIALADRNPFIKGYNGPPRSDPPPRSVSSSTPRPPSTPGSGPLDAAEFTYMVAAIASDGTQEIWLYDRSSNKYTFLTEGTEFKVAELEGRVVVIENDLVELLISGEMWELDLGKNMRQMRKVPKLPKSAKQ